MIIDFLKEFSLLTPAEQKVFIYCLEHKPSPQLYTGDIQEIAAATGLYYQSARKAIHSISASPILSNAVKYILTDIVKIRSISLDAAGDCVYCKDGRESR